MGRPVQTGDILVPVQKGGGQKHIRRQGGQSGPGDRTWDLGKRRGEKGMKPVDQRQGEKTPGQRKGQTHPSVEISGQIAVVPKGYPQNSFVKGTGQVFHSGGGECPEKEKRGGIFFYQAGKEKNEASPDAVDGAQRQDPQRFSIWASAGGMGVGHLQQKAQETI